MKNFIKNLMLSINLYKKSIGFEELIFPLKVVDFINPQTVVLQFTGKNQCMNINATKLLNDKKIITQLSSLDIKYIMDALFFDIQLAKLVSIDFDNSEGNNLYSIINRQKILIKISAKDLFKNKNLLFDLSKYDIAKISFDAGQQSLSNL